VRFCWGYLWPDARRPQRSGQRALRDLPDHKARRTTIEIGIEIGTETRISPDGIKPRHVQAESIAILIAVASGTRACKGEVTSNRESIHRLISQEAGSAPADRELESSGYFEVCNREWNRGYPVKG
jgi:hypothetical protein